MLARVTVLEGGTPEGIRAWADELRQRVPTGPPPGVESKGLTALVDPDGGRVMMIGLFENEDTLRSSEAALEQMDLPEGAGKRASKDIYEVAVEART